MEFLNFLKKRQKIDVGKQPTEKPKEKISQAVIEQITEDIQNSQLTEEEKTKILNFCKRLDRDGLRNSYHVSENNIHILIRFFELKKERQLEIMKMDEIEDPKQHLLDIINRYKRETPPVLFIINYQGDKVEKDFDSTLRDQMAHYHFRVILSGKFRTEHMTGSMNVSFQEI